MSHSAKCSCWRCTLGLKNDLAVSCGHLDPPTPAEEQYAEANRHTDTVVIPALERA